MDFPLLVDRLTIVAFAGLLVWAAWWDLRSFIIPNKICLAIAALYPAHVIALGHYDGVVGGLSAAGIVFGVGFILFAFHIVGGGDVKLMTAVALWAGPVHMPTYLLITGLAGGLLAALMAARAWRHEAEANPDGTLRLRLQAVRNVKVPYGTAIALGGLSLTAGIPVL